MFTSANRVSRGRRLFALSLTFVAILFAAGTVAGCAPLASHPDQHISSDSPGVFDTSTGKTVEWLMGEAMTSMDRGMKNAPMTGDPDHDFAAMMIPHHQGAIDMAKVELLYGRDPALRRLAQEIIVTQGQEIAVMQLRLEKFKAQ